MCNCLSNLVSLAADFAGYIPGISTGTGLLRTGYGYALKSISEYSLQYAGKDQRGLYRQRISTGNRHIDLGLLEARCGKLGLCCIETRASIDINAEKANERFHALF